jgi:hypothetical protein
VLVLRSPFEGAALVDAVDLVAEGLKAADAGVIRIFCRAALASITS